MLEKESTYSYLSYHTSVRNINLGLVGGSFVGFSAKEFEIFRSCSVLKLFHIGIIDSQSELAQTVRSLLLCF